LLSPWLWGYAGADSLPSRTVPQLSAEDEALVASSDRLLKHPAFATWTTRSEATLQAAEEVLRHPGWDLDVWVGRLSGELFAGQLAAHVLSERLTAMSEWLLLAGDELPAQLAMAAAGAIIEGPLQEQPLLRALVRRDLESALQSLE
jgi:hypothetical protein